MFRHVLCSSSILLALLLAGAVAYLIVTDTSITLYTATTELESYTYPPDDTLYPFVTAEIEKPVVESAPLPTPVTVASLPISTDHKQLLNKILDIQNSTLLLLQTNLGRGSVSNYSNTDIDRLLKIVYGTNDRTNDRVRDSIDDVTDGGELTNSTLTNLTASGLTTFNDPLTLAQVTAPSPSADKLYNLAGDLYWAGSVIGGASTGQWTSDGTNVWRAGGNVGIGISIPLAKLHISESGSGNSQLLVGAEGSGFARLTLDSANGDGAGQDYFVIEQLDDLSANIWTPAFGGDIRMWAGNSATTNQFVLDTSGNIGIGTSSPAHTLDLRGIAPATDTDIALTPFDNTGKSTLRVFNAAGRQTQVSTFSTTTGMLFGIPAANLSTYYGDGDNLAVVNAGGGSTYFTNPSTPLLTITNSGNVGIGTSTPSSISYDFDQDASITTRLHVDHAIRVESGGFFIGHEENYSPNQGGAHFTYDPVANKAYIGGFKQGVGANSLILQGSGGNVGIGTTSANSLLALSGVEPVLSMTATGGTNNAQIDLRGTASQVLRFSGDRGASYPFTIGHTIVDDSFRISGGANLTTNPRLTVDASGNVGINTVSPMAKLDVVGDVRARGPFDLNTGVKMGAEATSRPRIGFHVSDDNRRFKMEVNDTNTPTERLGIFSNCSGGCAETEWLSVLRNGNVGIGTTSPTNFKFHVAADSGSGQIRLSGSTNPLSNVYGGYDTSQDIGFVQAITEGTAFRAFAINPYGGNVGIGTTTPQTKLQVDGVITPAVDNTYTLGNSTYRFSEVYAANGVINTSDIRLKHDPQTLTYGLDTILALEPISYTWVDQPTQGTRFGLSAQHVRDLIPEIVAEGTDPNKTLGIRYTELIPIIINAIQSLADQVATLAQGVFENDIQAGRDLRADGRLCLGNTCVTEAELKALLQHQAGQGSTPSPTPDTTSEEDTTEPNEGATEPDDTVDTTDQTELEEAAEQTEEPPSDEPEPADVDSPAEAPVPADDEPTDA